VSVSVAAPTSPYKGLAPFEDSELDALLFFGRERESEVIAANLIAARITVLYGPSGVGKSSVLRAGVAHRLRQEHAVEVVVFSTWTGDPVAALIEAIGSEGDSLADSLDEAATNAAGDLYLILDQFEELFLYHPGGGRFAQQLAEVFRRSGSRVNVLIGMREDALARLDAMKAAIPNLLANRLRLELLDRSAGAAAILGPVGRYNSLVTADDAVDVEPELVEVVLDEVTAGRVELSVAGRGVAARGADENRIEAPYLQLVLARLWDVEAERGSRLLRRSTLRELGGAERIVQDHLERAMAALSPREKGAAAAMYNFLVTPSGTKIAHGIHDLAGYAAVDEREASAVLQRLSAERIVRASSENGPSTTRYEIYHDVLADAVLGWRTRFEADRRIEDERLAHQRRHRRLLLFGIATLIGLAVMAAVAVYALAQRSNANHQAAVARVERTKAERQRNIAVEQRREAQRKTREAQTAKAKEQRAREQAQANARLANAAKREAQSQRAAAEGNRKQALAFAAAAEAERGRAQVQAQLAKQQKNKAVRAEAVANRQKRIGFARELLASAQALIDENFEGSIRKSLAAASAFRRARVAPPRAVEDVLREGLLGLRLRAELPGGGPVRVTRFSPNGSILLVAGAGGARLFDLAHGFAMRRLRPVTQLADAAFGDNGRLLAAGGSGSDHSVHIWDVDTGTPLSTLLMDGAVLSVAFSPNGRLIASGGADGTARVWSVAGGLPLAVFRHPAGVSRGDDVQLVSFSPDGTRLLTVGGDRFARVFDVTHPERSPILLNHRDQVNTARFSHDGQLIATAGASNVVRIWAAGTGEEKFTLEGIGRVNDLAFSPDDTMLATAGGNDTIGRVWNLQRQTSIAIITAHKSGVTSVTFSPDGLSVVTTGRDGRAYIARTDGGFLQGQLLSHRGVVTGAAYSPNGELIATSGADGRARIWDARVDPGGPLPPAFPRELGSHGLAANAKRGPSVAFSPDGQRVLSAGADGTARLWGPGGRVLTLRHEGPVNVGSFSTDGRTVITASDDGSAAIWSVSDGRRLLQLKHGAPVTTASLSPNGKYAVTAGRDGVAILWDARRGAPYRRLKHGTDSVNDAKFSRDGRLVATAGADRTAVIWRVSDGARLLTLRGHSGSIVAVAFARDGRHVATASMDATARISDLRSGKSMELRGHTAALTALAFNGKGSLLATAAADSDARVWNVRSGREVAVLRIHAGPVNDVAFSADGRWLATAGPQAAGIWETVQAGAWPSAPVYLVRASPPRLDTLAFSKQGWRLVTGWRGGAVRVYDCKLCGRIAQLRPIARARLREIVAPRR
jgi:WD40 repeat protein